MIANNVDNKKIRLLIVDDSPYIRKLIIDLVSSDDGIEVVGTAIDGEEAIKKAEELMPDVITMDIKMPNVNGLKALSYLASKEFKVVMLSVYTGQGTKETITSLELGAVNFIRKPSVQDTKDNADFRKELIEKIYEASVANIKQLCYGKKDTQSKNKIKQTRKIETNNKWRIDNVKDLIVTIGISTGGPKALEMILPNFSKDFPFPILIVQHMPAEFTKSLAYNLNNKCELEVREASHGEPIKEKTIYIAPGGYHMCLTSCVGQKLIILNQDDPVRGHRPSYNKLLESLVEIQGQKVVAVTMTGMGSDGLEGIRIVKEKLQSYVIAQSEDSCVVFGMPRSVIEASLADEISHLGSIVDSIQEATQRLINS